MKRFFRSLGVFSLATVIGMTVGNQVESSEVDALPLSDEDNPQLHQQAIDDLTKEMDERLADGEENVSEP